MAQGVNIHALGMIGHFLSGVAQQDPQLPHHICLYKPWAQPSHHISVVHGEPGLWWSHWSTYSGGDLQNCPLALRHDVIFAARSFGLWLAHVANKLQ